MKKVHVNTPLILDDLSGTGQVRFEAGSIITLSDEVYEQVSAHVSLLDIISDNIEPTPSEPEAEEAITDGEQADTKSKRGKKAE